MFTKLNNLQRPLKIRLPDGNLKKVNKIGTVIVNKNLTLVNVLYVPDFKHNLMSVVKLVEDQGLRICFHKKGCIFQDPSSEKVVARASKKEGVYVLDQEVEAARERDKDVGVLSCHVNLDDNNKSTGVSVELMHARLGHGSLSKMRHLDFCNCKGVKSFFCDTCSTAKHHRLPFNLSQNMADDIFDLIHVDLWGPYKVANVTGDHYFFTIVDDNSRATWTSLLNDKSQVRHILEHFLAYVENHFNKSIKIIRSDNGTEIVQDYCEELFGKKGIIHQRSVVGVPQQNGRVERKHRTLLEMARALRIHAGLPKYLWGECLLAATHLINLLPSVVIGWQTPYEKLMKKKPSYDYLRTVGCLCYASKGGKKGDKFDERGVRCVFIGYPHGQKGYKVYDLKEKKLFVSRDVVFKEDIFPFLKREDPQDNLKMDMNAIPLTDKEIFIDDINFRSEEQSLEDADAVFQTEDVPQQFEPDTHDGMVLETTDQEGESDLPQIHEQQPELRRSTRERRIPEKLKDYEHSIPGKNVQEQEEKGDQSSAFFSANMRDNVIYSPDYIVSFNNVMKVQEPVHYNQAVQDEGWRVAMQSELDALEANDTWEYAVLPQGKKALDTKWVYKVKYKQDGNVERLKARLVARGDKQIKHKDYKHTFSPVAKFSTVRILLALASMKDWKLHQLDINNAFLHGYLEEEVYLKPPLGYDKVPEGQVCKLKRSLYGLKQASRQWNQELKHFLLHKGFKQCKRDYSLFCRFENGKYTIVLVYVDDLLISGDDEEYISFLKQSLDNQFTIKDLGEMRYFLGLEVFRNREGIVLNQRKYILDILTQMGLTHAKPSQCPFPKHVKLSTHEGKLLNEPEQYRRLIGRLLYLNLSRPDISYSVQQLSQFMSAPREPHWQAAIHLVKYLKGTCDLGLFYPRQGDLEVTAFSDADWGSCTFTGRSLTGWCVFLGKCLVTWKTKKQKTVSKSSAESELRSLSHTTSEVVWVDGVLDELFFSTPKPIRLYGDNKAALYIANDPVMHDRTKHLRLDDFYVREHVDSGFICTEYLRSSSMIADIMTKSLSEQQHRFFMGKLGLVPFTQVQLEGGVKRFTNQ
ncbi:Retrovirus-related Pol polyprotein from transposon TNT 1-94 [Bienertia sinuspersici]